MGEIRQWIRNLIWGDNLLDSSRIINPESDINKCKPYNYREENLGRYDNDGTKLQLLPPNYDPDEICKGF